MVTRANIQALNNFTHTLPNAAIVLNLTFEELRRMLWQFNEMNRNTPMTGPHRAHGISAEENVPAVPIRLMVSDGATRKFFEITAADPLLDVLDTIEHEMRVEKGFYTLSFPHFTAELPTEILSSHRDYSKFVDYHIKSVVALGTTSMNLALRRLEAGTDEQLAANAIADFIVAEAANYGGGLGGGTGGAGIAGVELGAGIAAGEESDNELLAGSGDRGGRGNRGGRGRRGG